MQKIMIVEDDLIQTRVLTDTIQNAYPDWEITKAYSYPEAQTLLQDSLRTKEYYTLFLLDIQLSLEPGDRGGFLLADELRTKEPYYRTPILFLTAVSDEQSFALSHFHCYNYLPKPYTPDDIIYQLRQMLLTGYLEQNMITLNDINRILYRVHIPDILYCVSQSHTVQIFTSKGKICTRDYSLDKLAMDYPRQLIRCHRKYVVQLSKITSFDKTTRMLHVDNAAIPIGLTYLSTIERVLLLPSYTL